MRAYLRAVALAEPVQAVLAERHGLSLGDFHAVRVLLRLGEVPVSRFGGELGIPRSTITNLVDRLEKAGLVERAASPSDRRVTLVRLSAMGERAVEDMSFLLNSQVAQRLFALDPQSQEALAALLERVVTPPAEAAAAPQPAQGSETSGASAVPTRPQSRNPHPIPEVRQ